MVTAFLYVRQKGGYLFFAKELQLNCALHTLVATD
jgi:hypothetical protein